MERVHQMRVNGEDPEGEGQMTAARRAYPEMKTFQAWAEQRKGKPSQRSKNWNNVTVSRLVRGKQ